MDTAILNLEGANCPSCVYTIEHLGRKVPGIKEIHVDVNAKEIRVEYEGEKESLYKVSNIVKTLGYSAEIKDNTVR